MNTPMHSHRHESDTEDFDREGRDDEGIFDDIVGGIGKVLNPLSMLQSVLPNSSSSGVQSARLSTPQGNASLRLPEPVVTERVFKESMARLDSNINTLRTSVNRDRVAIQATVKGQDHVLSTMRRTVRKLEDRRQQDMWMNMLTTMMLQQGSHGELMNHTHLATGSVNPESVPANNSSMMFMMLPMMMGDGGFGGSSNSGSDSSSSAMMMPMMMMMMMAK